MADAPRTFPRHALLATLRHERGSVLLAAAAIAIGVSVAAALMHVSSDVGRKVTRELRALGPNLVVLPATGETIDIDRALETLGRAGVVGTPLLYSTASVRGEPVPVIGADLDDLSTLHPHWHVTRAGDGALAGTRLLDRLRARPGDTLPLVVGGQPSVVPIGARLEAGGADDEALWLPLDDLQRATGLAGRASLMQSRIDGGREEAERVRAAIESGGELRVSILGALTEAEAGLLERLRRIMALVTVSALVAAGLCAFGVLTDRALERRKDFALLKALGAHRGEIVGQFAAEALAIGLTGGLAGWVLGLVMAQVIGLQVFHSAIAVRAEVPLVVIALALLVAVAGSIGPARLALAVEPATALKGD